MDEAIALSEFSVAKWWWPFGCIIVKDWIVIGKWHNHVAINNDPTAHAEVMAIRDACQNIGSFHLDWAQLYTSCEPCPMCLGAIYRAHIDKIYYANTAQDAMKIDFDDKFIYDEFAKTKSDRNIQMIQMGRDAAIKVFENWASKQDKIKY